MQRTYSGGGDLFAEPLTPPGHSRRKNGEELVSPNESSPGLLDLHSFDTELLPEVNFLTQEIYASMSYEMNSIVDC